MSNTIGGGGTGAGSGGYTAGATTETYQLISEKSQVNGYASLGTDGKVPLSELPAGAVVTEESFGALIGGATEKATPVDADRLPLSDSADTNKLKWYSWANLKATLKTYFDTLYIAHSLATAANDFLIASGVGTFVKKTLAETKAILVGGGVVDTSTAQTLTNKRVTKRTDSTTSSATPTINTDNVDTYALTAQAVDITSFTDNLSGTPVLGDLLAIFITGTAARAITWGASFEAGLVALPTTTVTTTTLNVLFRWNTVTSKWYCMHAGSTA